MKSLARELRLHVATLWIALFAALLLASTPVFADRSVLVSGEGEVTAWPDFIRLNLTVTAEAKSASDAKKRVDTATNAVLNIAKKAGINDDDISAARITNTPVYDWINNKRTLRGEQVSRSVVITLRDLTLLGSITHQLIQVADVNINSSTSGFDDAAGLVMQATDIALSQAQAKAERMAARLGHRLGKVISIEEQGSSVAAPAMAEVRSLSAKADNTSAPMMLQAEIISSRVSVRFELK